MHLLTFPMAGWVTLRMERLRQPYQGAPRRWTGDAWPLTLCRGIWSASSPFERVILQLISQTIRDRFPVIEQYVRGRTVMDLGCVDSRAARHDAAARIEYKANLLHKRIAEVNREVLGVDIDPAGVEVLNQQGYQVIVADVETMDLGKRFDTIVAGEIIEHLENPGKFLRNMHRHLNPQGTLIISTPNPFYAGSAWKIWRYGTPAVHEEHMGWQDPTTLGQLLKRTGFVVFEAYWVQPHPAVLKTWKRLLRPYFSHTFMMLARPA